MRALRLAIPALAALAGPAAAQGFGNLPPPPERPWFLRVDVAGVMPALRGETSVAGFPVPGNTVSVNNSATVSLDIGRFITDKLAIAALIGVPPKATLTGSNALAPVGVGATARYGPAALMLQYHPGQVWNLRPYLGVGLSYTPFLDVKGVALQDPKLPNAWGAAFQLGADYPLTDRWALNLDAVKVLASTTATGSLGGIPVSSALTFNPLILRGGVTWRF